jgi:tetratricopeptide (TPR) repeat protein
MTVALLGSAAVVSAQMELGAIQGTVKDEAGKPLEGVVIKITDSAHGREVQVKTDKNGSFYRRGLQAVDYDFIVEKPGYNPIRDQLRVSAGLEKRYDFKLVKAAPEGAEEFAKGVAAFNSGNNAAAAAAFEESMKKAPDLPEVRVNLALAYMRLSRTPEAVAQLEKARSLAPDKPSVLFQLGEAYVEMKDYDKAIAAIEEGLKRAPTANDPVALDGMVTLGAVYFAKGDNDKAIAQFEKALTLKSDAAAPRLGLAKAQFSKGELDKALTNFKLLMTTSPGTTEALQAQAFVTELEKK